MASRADAFLLVEKNVIDDSTVSNVTSLNENQAIEEVTKLIDGGKVASVTAIEHAKRLFSQK